MKYVVSIKRQKDNNSKPYIFSIDYESDGNESIATMLENINKNIDEEDKILWQCSCLQKKCGACAMVINNVPKLACSTFLRETGKKIKLEPLSKFPVVKDLMVNREYVYEMLRQKKMWMEKNNSENISYYDQRFKAAACIMCGCCLEVCPNFSVVGKHLGAVGINAAYRLRTSEKDSNHDKELTSAYMETVYNTCGKALSCVKVCPMNLPIEELMVRNNGM